MVVFVKEYQYQKSFFKENVREKNAFITIIPLARQLHFERKQFVF